MSQSTGVAIHAIGQGLPNSLKDALPTIEQLEAELNTAAAAIEPPTQG
jgi:hypothetical protein